MKIFSQGLLTLLISLFILPACKVSSTDLVLDTKDGIKGTLTDTISVISRTVAEKPLLTGGLSLYPFGFINDPTTGTTEATISASVVLPFSNYSFGTNPVLDSAVLILPLSSNYYGDTTTSFTVEVRHLKNSLATDANYLSDFVHPTEDEVIGSYTGVIYPRTAKKIIQVIAKAKDDTVSIFPHIRIPISKTFIDQWFLNAKSSDFATGSAFYNYFKGIQISIKNNGTPNSFGTFFSSFVTSDANYAGLQLVYKTDNTTTAGLRDTVNSLFSIDPRYSDIASTVKHNYDNTPVSAALQKEFSTNEASYMTPLSGTLMEIKTPNLDPLRRLGKVIINKVELVIPIVSGTDVFPYTPSQQLFIYTLDKADQKALVTDGQLVNTGSSFIPNPGLGGIYDSKNKNYVFNLTQYFQNLVDNKLIAKSLFVGQVYPLITINASSTPVMNGIVSTFSSGNRSVTVSNKDGMKFKIYYTLVGN